MAPLIKKKKYYTFLILFLSVVFLLFNLIPVSGGEVVDKIAALVNDKPITMNDISKEIILLRNEIPEELKNRSDKEKEEYLQKKALDNLIDEELQYQEAGNKGISISNETVELAIEDQKKTFGMTDANLEASLRSEGITLSDYKEKVRRQLTLMTLLNNAIKPRINITSTEIKDYYNEHIDFFTKKGEVTLAQLVIMFSEPDKKENAIDRTKIDEVLAKAQNGIPLEELEKNYTEFFDLIKYQYLGNFKKEELADEFREAFDIKVNECILVKTKEAFHILKLLKRKSDSLMPFAEAGEEIKNILYGEKNKKIMKKFIESLREKAYIENKL